MVSQTVVWHSKCNKNTKIYLDKKIKELRMLSKEIDKIERNWLFKDKQIAEAIVRGKKMFDDTRFLFKKLDTNCMENKK